MHRNPAGTVWFKQFWIQCRCVDDDDSFASWEHATFVPSALLEEAQKTIESDSKLLDNYLRRIAALREETVEECANIADQLHHPGDELYAPYNRCNPDCMSEEYAQEIRAMLKPTTEGGKA